MEGSSVVSWQLKVETRRGEHFHFHLHLLLWRHMSKESYFFPGTILTWRDLIYSRSASYALVSGPCIKPKFTYIFVSRAYITPFTANNTSLYHTEDQVHSS